MRFIPCERVGLPDMQKARAESAGFLALCYPVVQPFEQRNPTGLTPVQPRGPAAKTKTAYGFPYTACKTELFQFLHAPECFPLYKYEAIG